MQQFILLILPAGLLAGLVLLEFLNLFRKRKDLDGAASALMAGLAISIIGAVAYGASLLNEGITGKPFQEMEWGVLLAITATFALWLKFQAKKQMSLRRAAYRKAKQSQGKPTASRSEKEPVSRRKSKEAPASRRREKESTSSRRRREKEPTERRRRSRSRTAAAKEEPVSRKSSRRSKAAKTTKAKSAEAPERRTRSKAARGRKPGSRYAAFASAYNVALLCVIGLFIVCVQTTQHEPLVVEANPTETKTQPTKEPSVPEAEKVENPTTTPIVEEKKPVEVATTTPTPEPTTPEPAATQPDPEPTDPDPVAALASRENSGKTEETPKIASTTPVTTPNPADPKMAGDPNMADPNMTDDPTMKEDPAMADPAIAANTPVSFSTHVRPTLKARCYSCHGEDKQKGELRLDHPKHILKGGENGAVIFAGHPQRSSIYTLVALPPDHDDIMPPKGDPLTPNQAAAIKMWIEQGANFGAALNSPMIALTDDDPAMTDDPAPTPDPATPPQPVQPQVKKTVSFGTHVKPILAKYCYDCHGADEQKASLSVHTPAAIRSGGKGGAVVIPFQAAKSKLYFYTTLPADDADVMPSKGPLLTDKEKLILKTWVEEGADLEDGGTWSASGTGDMGPTHEDKLAQTILPPRPDQVKSLERGGLLIKSITPNGALLEVDYSHTTSKAGYMRLERLELVKDNVYALDLSTTPVSDKDLEHVAKLKNLTSLRLHRTNITDAGLKHLSGLKNLVYINLFSTQVSDTGMEIMANLPNLREIYLWNTKVTPVGVGMLQEANPYLKVNVGD